MTELEKALEKRDDLLARGRAGQRVRPTDLKLAVDAIRLAALIDFRRDGTAGFDSPVSQAFARSL